MASIVLDTVNVDLPIFDAHQRSLRHSVMAMTVGGVISQKGRFRHVRALDSVSLSIGDGDRIGLIGRNGAGKTTLLRVLAGICEPTTGRATVEGTVSNLLAMRSLLDPEMNGYENIEHASLLLGMPRSALPDLIQDVEEFTELGPFLDMPVRTYSAGMQVRLSFALLTAPTPDILLLDEVLGAGDAGFAAKAAKRIDQLRNRSRILVLASHAQDQILDWCDRVLWLDHGRLVAFGPAREILDDYRQSLAQS
jgi:ABC-type polysaccharide/polyol phosphate transport system ATPase subunit